MGQYSLRNGALTTKKVEVGGSAGIYDAPYIKLTPVANGGAAVYLFVGTAGSLCLATAAPVGTSGAFANSGKVLGTAA